MNAAELDAIMAEDRAIYGPCGCSSTERPHRIIEWAERLSDDDGAMFWRVVKREWSTFDLIPHQEFERLFARFDSHLDSTDAPCNLTVYRGQSEDDGPGLSWTTSLEVAQAFARGHRGMSTPNPCVHQINVSSDEIAFTCDDRDESEVVLREIPLLE